MFISNLFVTFPLGTFVLMLFGYGSQGYYSIILYSTNQKEYLLINERIKYNYIGI